MEVVARSGREEEEGSHSWEPREWAREPVRPLPMADKADEEEAMTRW